VLLLEKKRRRRRRNKKEKRRQERKKNRKNENNKNKKMIMINTMTMKELFQKSKSLRAFKNLKSFISYRTKHSNL